MQLKNPQNSKRSWIYMKFETLMKLYGIHEVPSLGSRWSGWTWLSYEDTLLRSAGSGFFTRSLQRLYKWVLGSRGLLYKGCRV